MAGGAGGGGGAFMDSIFGSKSECRFASGMGPYFGRFIDSVPADRFTTAPNSGSELDGTGHEPFDDSDEVAALPFPLN